ncbi:MAG TPA: isoleucine--tRNA ligase [Alphaproteobacteria bacterium]|jgi:isoleucyl-tRNA synthetase|nr:isoleucine--tRNA ligase [Alphaproteobacteria bacterium]
MADYKSTVFLPKTAFAMKGGLPKLEPELLARWEKIDLFGKLRAKGQNGGKGGHEKFVLHDGPPYANGNIHIGHALNKILKDVINRSRAMQGFDVPYVPGWDCHGLPIEWKIEEEYRAKGKDKDQVPINVFRDECRAFAARWVKIQAEEFKRLGIVGDWAHPYTTMEPEAEAAIVNELGKFLLNGGLYKGVKPVMWSVVEKTALAEAEVEYLDHTSTTVWVKFPVVTASVPALEGASVVIWTTTPWTLPANRAIAYGEEFAYAVVEVLSTMETSLAKVGDKVVVAKDLLPEVAKDAGIADYKVLAEIEGAQLAGTIAAHPLRGADAGYGFDVPLLAGAHVTVDQGTGFVHIAPSHGPDDFVLGQQHGLEVPETVGPDGLYTAQVPLFQGAHVFKADKPVVEKLIERGALLARGTLVHSYPHSWRSKAPLIYRATPQWFISMEKNGLREKALDAIAETKFFPEMGRNRIRAMVEQRPDWCVSRQRAWGVPITVFVNKKTGEALRDERVMARIVEAVRKGGTDVWFSADPQTFLGNEFKAAEWEPVRDILDVWFDSGSTHAFVLEQRPELKWPASLYLEGSDQHRGWFQSSLLESCGTRGRAPYDAVLTHGFVLDEQGRKMSKSLGNVVAPQEVMDSLGADVLRLWVMASDYSEDLRIGPDILKHQTEAYRRLRNTLRYLLGALDGFKDTEAVKPADMPELERFVLHKVWELDAARQRANETYEFHKFYTALHAFCASDLSAFYFDIRKDSLYCDRPDSLRRRSVRTVLNHLFETLVAWLAPVLVFTAEEAWLARHKDGGDAAGSVHLTDVPVIPASWRDDALAGKWEKIRALRRVVTGAIELERAKGVIGSSLQAAPAVYAEDEYRQALDGLDLAEIAIASDVILHPFAPPGEAFQLADVPGVAVVPLRAGGSKCQRCWRVLEEVGKDARHPDICGRCADAVGAVGA